VPIKDDAADLNEISDPQKEKSQPLSQGGWPFHRSFSIAAEALSVLKEAG